MLDLAKNVFKASVINSFKELMKTMLDKSKESNNELTNMKSQHRKNHKNHVKF